MSHSPDQPAWHCVRTQPTSEHIAARHLQPMPGVEVFCPRLRFRMATERGAVWFSEALFPGYLFARFVPAVSKKEIGYAEGVSTIVRFGNQLARIPDETIAELRSHMGEEEFKTLDDEIPDGPMAAPAATAGAPRGLSTVLTQLLPASLRVRVLLDFLAQCREAEIQKENLPAGPDPLLAR